jgi:hypothetical protein
MRIAEGLTVYTAFQFSRVNGQPANPTVSRPGIATAANLRLSASELRAFYDAVHGLREAFQGVQDHSLPPSELWTAALDTYLAEPSGRDKTPTCFDALNLHAWRLFFQKRGINSAFNQHDPLLENLRPIGTRFGEFVVAKASSVATNERQFSEEFISNLVVLSDLLDCPPQVLPNEVVEKVIEVLKPCVAQEQFFYGHAYPIVGFDSTLWNIFAPLTIERTLRAFDFTSVVSIAASIERLYETVQSPKADYDDSDKQCVVALHKRVHRAPYANNKVHIKTLLHFLYPIAFGTRAELEGDFLRDGLDALDNIVTGMKWCS